MKRPRPYPVLLAFLAFFAGIVAAGMLGAAHALALVSLLGVLAESVSRIRHGRTPSAVLPLIGFLLLGAARMGLEDASWNPGDLAPLEQAFQSASSDSRIRVRIRVTRVLRRDHFRTRAEAEALSAQDGEHWLATTTPTKLVVATRGLLPLVEGGEYVMRGRLTPPMRRSDSLAPSWPSAPPRPVLHITGPEAAVAIPEPGGSFGTPMDRARMTLASRLRESLERREAEFVLAVLIGEDGGLDPEVRADLSDIGTAHILSVSGIHVAAVGFLIGTIFLKLLAPILIRLSPAVNLVRIRLVACAVAAMLTAGLAGFTPAPVRSGGMFVIGTLAIFLGRRQGLEAVIALAGLANLLVAPSDAFSLSFLLSYGAVLGIALLTAPIQDCLFRILPTAKGKAFRVITTALAASLAASLATTPITLAAFGTASVWSPLVNLVVIPVTGFVVMPVALLLLAAIAFLPAALGWLAPPAQVVLGLFLDGQQALAAMLPDPAWQDSTLASGLAVVLPVVAIGAMLPSPGIRWPTRLAAALVPAGLAMVLVRAPTTPVDPGAMVVTFLSAGKGDAIRIRCPDGRDFLIDTGSARDADGPNSLAVKLRASGVRELAGILLTHGDEDHCGGTEAVARSMDVAEVIVPCPAENSALLSGVIDRLAVAGVPARCVVSGMEALPGCGDSSSILWPPPGISRTSNAASLVFRLDWEGRSVLLSGDLETPEERILAGSDAEALEADVLKLGHHGSRFSSSPEFLEAVRPAIVVASGYPTRTRREIPSQTLERVSGTGARLFSTARDGDVSITLKADGVVVSGSRPP